MNKSYIALITIASLVVIGFFVRVSYNNQSADAEVFVKTAVETCAVTYDNGIKSVIEMAQVDRDTKEYLVKVIDSATAEQKSDIGNAYGEFVNGNTQPFMLMLGTMSGTNLTVTSENLQREVSAQRNAMLQCSSTLLQSQRQLKGIVGMNASGEVVKFPQSILGLSYPSPVTDLNLEDNDGDGKLTVLDYQPPVSVDVAKAFKDGSDIPATNIYGE